MRTSSGDHQHHTLVCAHLWQESLLCMAKGGTPPM